jgi:hypothetical protein
MVFNGEIIIGLSMVLVKCRRLFPDADIDVYEAESQIGGRSRRLAVSGTPGFEMGAGIAYSVCISILW